MSRQNREIMRFWSKKSDFRRMEKRDDEGRKKHERNYPARSLFLDEVSTINSCQLFGEPCLCPTYAAGIDVEHCGYLFVG